jgi:hypothetical protein
MIVAAILGETLPLEVTLFDLGQGRRCYGRSSGGEVQEDHIVLANFQLFHVCTSLYHFSPNYSWVL